MLSYYDKIQTKLIKLFTLSPAFDLLLPLNLVFLVMLAEETLKEKVANYCIIISNGKVAQEQLYIYIGHLNQRNSSRSNFL